jgi:hypothetical protein
MGVFIPEKLANSTNQGSFKFLLDIIVVQRDTLWYLHMCLQCILVRFTPSIVLPHPSHPFLEQVSFFYFHLWIPNTSTIFTLIRSFLIPSPCHCALFLFVFISFTELIVKCLLGQYELRCDFGAAIHIMMCMKGASEILQCALYCCARQPCGSPSPNSSHLRSVLNQKITTSLKSKNQCALFF